jgi:hypothetical protein
MTIPEYLAVMDELKKLSPEMKKFLADICVSVGHEIFKDANQFADVCTRCGDMTSWMNQKSSLDKIAAAMTSPLKTKLDYISITKKIVKLDKFDVGDLPIYDKDIDVP